MRVMLLHKSTADTEAGKVPPMDLIQRVGAMIAAMKAADVFRDGAGLRSSALGVRLTFAGGKRHEQAGPFVGRNEDPAALCILKVRSRDEAVQHASSFAAVLGDGECDIRPVTEPWDLGFGEKPKDDPTTRYMLVWKAQREGGDALPSLQARAALGKLIADLTAQGVFQQGEAFRPSRVAKRIAIAPGKRRAVDGPFAESKELISGFCTIEVPSLPDALPWAERYIAAVGEVELDLRPLFEPGDLKA
ncbi:MAG TPA: YciI family protein [Gemmatimonadales bacterium]|nr:YciI family protein [Gemmatimonadales bacterium]